MLVSDLIVFRDANCIIVRGVGAPKELCLPSEVVLWLRSNRKAIRVLDALINNYKFKRRLCNRGALRSLILLLYAKSLKMPPYKIARSVGVSPEQLYRIERGLREDGLIDMVDNMLR